MVLDIIFSKGKIDIIEVLVAILSSLAVIFLTLPVHEFAHGFIAEKLGDKTPRWQGRITLNPFAHIDWIGAAFIILFGFGWAKPVQVNARNFRNPKAGMAIVAVAGPISNLIVALICMLIMNGLGLIPVASIALLKMLSYIIYFFAGIAQINIYLAVFNLLPIPPLDGSRVLTAFLPYKYYNLIMQYEQYIHFLLMFLIFSDVLDKPLMIAANAVWSLLSFLAYLPFSFLS